MDREAVFRKPRLLRALTSLDAGEFTRLLAAFEQESQARRGQFNRFGQERQRAPGSTGNAGVLSTPKARLFFVLFYFKCYPLQEVMGVLFGLSQPQVCLWIGRLTPLVNTALGKELVLPARRPARNWRQGMVDEVMVAASGLHNLRVAARTGEKVPSPHRKPHQSLTAIKSNLSIYCSRVGRLHQSVGFFAGRSTDGPVDRERNFLI